MIKPNGKRFVRFLRGCVPRLLVAIHFVPGLTGTIDYGALGDVPAVIRRNRAAQVEALQSNGMDHLDIPAFLRKQAD